MKPLYQTLLYRTRSGVLVTITARKKVLHRNGRWLWKGDASRLTGGRHGWLWMHLLEAVSAAPVASGGSRLDFSRCSTVTPLE